MGSTNPGSRFASTSWALPFLPATFQRPVAVRPHSCPLCKAPEDKGFEGEDEKRRADSLSTAGLPNTAISRGASPVKRGIRVGITFWSPFTYTLYLIHLYLHGFIEGVSQGALVVKNLPANAGNARYTSSIPGSGRAPGTGNGNPLQFTDISGGGVCQALGQVLEVP